MSAVPGEHLQKQTLTIEVYIPDHPDRTESPIFRATRKKLIEDNPDACCWICGTKDGLQLHHKIEWCDAEAVDWAVVAKDFPAFNWAQFDPSIPATFIDSEHNAAVILCGRHHIGHDHGVHMLPWPLFVLQRYKKAGFVFSPDEAPTGP